MCCGGLIDVFNAAELDSVNEKSTDAYILVFCEYMVGSAKLGLPLNGFGILGYILTTAA